MGKKKKLRKIVDAVSGIIGDDTTKRKLKKVEAISRFKDEMDERLSEIQTELHEVEHSQEHKNLLKRHFDVLFKQIGKTEKLLKKLDE